MVLLLRILIYTSLLVFQTLTANAYYEAKQIELQQTGNLQRNSTGQDFLKYKNLMNNKANAFQQEQADRRQAGYGAYTSKAANKFTKYDSSSEFYTKSAITDVKARTRFAVLDRKRFQIPGSMKLNSTKKSFNIDPFNVDNFYVMSFSQGFKSDLKSSRFYGGSNGSGFLTNSFGFEVGYAKRIMGNSYGSRLAGIDKSNLKFNNIQNLRDPDYALKKQKSRPMGSAGEDMFFVQYGFSINYFAFNATNKNQNEVALSKRILIATPNVKLIYMPLSLKMVMNLPKYGPIVSQPYFFPELGLSMVSYSNKLSFAKSTENYSKTSVVPLLGLGCGLMTDISRFANGDKNVFLNTGLSYRMLASKISSTSSLDYFNEKLSFSTMQLNIGAVFNW
jgi:hypothetical protein